MTVNHRIYDKKKYKNNKYQTNDMWRDSENETDKKKAATIRDRKQFIDSKTTETNQSELSTAHEHWNETERINRRTRMNTKKN